MDPLLVLTTPSGPLSLSAPLPEAFIKDAIASHDAVIFSKTYCPYCTRTKDLFRDVGAGKDVAVFELDNMENGDAIQGALLAMTKQRTVPNVFVKGQHIGGNDDSQKAAREGKLQAMLGGSVAMMALSSGVLDAGVVGADQACSSRSPGMQHWPKVLG